MSATRRDVTISIRGVKLIVEVLTRSTAHPSNEPRRFCVRQAGNKEALDEILDAGVLSEIDKRIRGGEYDAVDADIPFDVPMPAGGAG
jgi:hypothetical protein